MNDKFAKEKYLPYFDILEENKIKDCKHKNKMLKIKGAVMLECCENIFCRKILSINIDTRWLKDV